ncbi:MFS transporter [Streptomyces sp. NPDC097981]|uniref:MFS transporter n=1 Tax=Streptomyces sp. NPDC097981 TaxID=3155428 RepID=UPI00332B1427
MTHTAGRRAELSRGTVLILASTCAVAVGNIYFPQAISPLIAAGLGVSPDTASLVVTATQIGYTAGMFLLVPLGDRLPHRPFLVVLLALSGVALLAAGCAPALPFLVAAGAFAGVTTVAAQVVAPMAAGLVAPDRRGAVMGTLLSGSIGGMLLARTFSSTLGEWLGWRAPYLAASVLVLLLAGVLARTLPATTPPSRSPYGALLADSLRLLRTEPRLRRSCLYQASVFGGFSAVWTCLALLVTGPAYGMGTQAVGMLALVGGVTMLCTPLAGRLVDRGGPDRMNFVCLTGVLLAAAVLAAGASGGTPGLAALTVGTLLLDIALQCGTVANQARVFSVRPDARGRLNTAYMTCAYLGGSAGSWLGVRTYGLAGWRGVCALVAVLAALALARHLAPPSAAPEPPGNGEARPGGSRTGLSLGPRPLRRSPSASPSGAGSRRRPVRRGSGRSGR